MAKRVDWDRVQRKQRGQRHGTSYAYDELPPVGSYADQVRNLSNKSQLKSDQKGGEKTQAKRKSSRRRGAMRTPEDRLRNLRKNLSDLMSIPESKRWHNKGVEYQHRVLIHISDTLNAMLRLCPSASQEELATEAKRILAGYPELVVNLNGSTEINT